MKCPFCGGEMRYQGELREIVANIKAPLVGSIARMMPSDVSEIKVYVCEGCGFIAFFRVMRPPVSEG